MKYEVAYKYMEDFQRELTQYRQEYTEDFINAHGKALEALEKQIQKKTKRKKNDYGEFEYFCPTCGCYVGYKGSQSLCGCGYCGDCGQYLDFDWIEE